MIYMDQKLFNFAKKRGSGGLETPLIVSSGYSPVAQWKLHTWKLVKTEPVTFCSMTSFDGMNSHDIIYRNVSGLLNLLDCRETEQINFTTLKYEQG
jgi:hypothetical protein